MAAATLGKKYSQISSLGRGSFGEVYLVEHTALQAPRALKVLHADTLGVDTRRFAEARQRFELEAQIGAQLEQSAHVIHVYDVEEDAGALVLVMEYAPGGSLADRLRTAAKNETPLEIAEVVRIARETALGLAALHDLDGVHRDVKPSNILFDEAERARLADFGLTQTSYGLAYDSRLGSEAAPHPGTPAYMSPEQRASTDHLAPASDVYALGAVIFEMLTGRMWRNARPGTTPRALRPDVPVWLDDIVMRCLADDPADRPWDGEELARLLTERGVEIRWVEVPAGAFLMGCDPAQDPAADADEAPQHHVRLSAYQIGMHPVTVAQFAAFVDVTGYVTAAESRGWSVAFTGDQFERVSGADWRHPRGLHSTIQTAHPVVHVSWDDAAAFCRWASQTTGLAVRLPTEAEWEKAARGADRRRFPWGVAAPIGSRCNIGKRTLDTTPVGTFSPQGDSLYGCADMAGNIWEWCADWYAADAYASAPPYNPTGPDQGTFRVVRGGAWHAEDDFARTTLRLWHAPAEPHGLVGFRCVMVVQGHEYPMGS